MSGSIYIFNPENDLSVANGGENYMAPPRARIIAEDLALLPVWYAYAGDDVLVPSAEYAGWMSQERALLGCSCGTMLKDHIEDKAWSSFVPWGWSPEIVRRLSRLGISQELLPDMNILNEQKRLYHRNQTIMILEELRKSLYIGTPEQFPVELYTGEEVCRYIESAPFTVLKAPWSGSGKGLSWGRGVYDTTLERWSRGILRRQGSIIGEPYYEKVQDFAMEFYSDGLSGVSFSGYSFFDTDKKGVYKGNLLASDSDIQSRLSVYVSKDRLETVKNKLADILSGKVSPFYKGYLGIDMMIYKDADGFRLHPCVELNLRMNMGMVSRIFYDRFVSPEKTGCYAVDYEPDPMRLYADHQDRLRERSLQISNGKITSGYLSLSPITPETHYRARVEIG